MPTLDRRAFVLALAAAAMVGLPPALEARTPAVPQTGAVLLGRRFIKVSSNSITMPMRTPQRACEVFIRTEASGYWLDGIELADACGSRSAQFIMRRILPGLDFKLDLSAMPSRELACVVLHHAYLPLESGRAYVEAWARTA